MWIRKGFKILWIGLCKGLVGQFSPPRIGLTLKSSGTLIPMYALFIVK